jgi:hypothetical protein
MPTKRKPTIGTYITSARIEARYLSKRLNKIKTYLALEAKNTDKRNIVKELELRLGLDGFANIDSRGKM